MSPSQALESVLREHLQSVAAPPALWDRVWQPRLEKQQKAKGHGWAQGFAFGLPVLAAAALIFTVAMRNPAHDVQHSLRTAIPAKQGQTEIVYQVDQVERAQAVRAISRREPASTRKAEARVDANCSLCHTL